MRRFLDGLYGAAGLLAGLCTIGVLVAVLAAISAMIRPNCDRPNPPIHSASARGRPM